MKHPAPAMVSNRSKAGFASLLVFGLVLATPALPAGATMSQAAAEQTAANLSVGTLEVENRTDPLGIDVPAPRFSWITSTDARDVSQISYRIRVAASEAELEAGDVWDSGVVESAASVGVEFGGEALEPAKTYWWRVDVVTDAGSASATATFATGLFDEADWAGSAWIGNARPDASDILDLTGASWIWTPETGAPYAPAEDRAFRYTLTAPEGKTAASADIVLTADDSYQLWVDGRLLGETAGAENEWQGSKAYTVALDGDAVIAVRTTNGPNSPAGLIAKVRVIYTDGTTATITTDATWKASKQVPAGFEQPGFDDSAWAPAAVHAVYGTGPWGSGVRPATGVVAPAPLMRKEFELDQAVASAKIYVAAGGYANVSLNGAPINDEILSPGFTDYDDRAQYTVTDVTSQLRAGGNAVGIELGRGFYGMTNPNVWNWQSAPFHDDPVGRALLRVQYEDGSTEDVVTDDSWTIHDGPTLLDDLYGGETYDARNVQPGFDAVGFDDGGWMPASEVAGPGGDLVNQQQQPIRVTEELPATEVVEVATGVWRVMFPRVIAGNVRITAQGPAGTTIRAQYGEKLYADGRVNFSNNGGFANGFQTDRFVLAGTGADESWAGRFSYKGFQYIEVTGWPGGATPPASAFTAEVLHTDAPETGSFESADPIMNATHRAVVDTLKNNLHGIPTDTPMFEKNGWTGDAAVGAEMFLLNLDSQNLLEKWIDDISDSRDANGAPLVIAPSSDQWGQWGVATPWHSAYILVPRALHQYGGNTQVLAKHYDGMAAYVDLEFGRSPGGVVPENRLGDWVSPEASPAGGNAPEDTRVSGTAYLYAMLTAMSETATLLGRDDDAARFDEQAAVVKAGFNRTFLDAEAGYYRGSGDNGYRQTHNALALAFDLAPDAETAQRVADSIAADVTARGDKLNTGTLGTKYLLPVLTEYGHADLAYRVAVQTGYPSWGYMIENGATSMWEHWSLEARSRGHYFLGTVDDWFFHDVAGIQPSETTGYRDITIAPAVTDQLEWAKATTQTPYGAVSSDWSRTGGALRLGVNVPVGSTATVRVPADSRWAVTEGGASLADVDGIREVSDEDGVVVVTIGSGAYEFVTSPETEAVGGIIDRIDTLSSAIDDAREAGAISEAEQGAGQAIVADIRASIENALGVVRDEAPESTSGAEALAGALDEVDRLDDWVDGLADASARPGLGEANAALRDAVEQAVSTVLGVSVSLAVSAPSFAPDEPGRITATVGNSGPATLTGVTGMIDGLGDGWRTSATPVSFSDVGPDAAASADLDFTPPATQKPGTVDASVIVQYRFSGRTIALRGDAEVTIVSALRWVSVTAEPAQVEPGGTTEVVAVVRNTGGQPVTGRVEVAAPQGWQQPLPSAAVTIPAGGEATVRVPVTAPLGLQATTIAVELTASFVVAGSPHVTSAVPVTIVLAGVENAYDHIDLGVAADEQAHGLTASSSSGTSVEAGLTRRYAGHLTDFSYFEFDLDVEEGKAFVLRSTETYDRAQTKKYKVYVNGELVTTRTHAHTGGAGTVTWETVVDASFATSGTVRVRFENLDDHAFFDPSIADVWSLPLPVDARAPIVVATLDPAAAAAGWVTTTPVSITLAAQDDRVGSVTVTYSVDGKAWRTYSGAIKIARDGEHVVSYRAQDAAGNLSEVQELTVRIDTKAPKTKATPGATFTGRPPVSYGPGTVNLQAQDGGSGVAATDYRVNGGAWTTGDVVTIDTVGAFTIDYRSRDVAGNVEQVRSFSGEIKPADTVKPTVTVKSGSSFTVGSNGVYSLVSFKLFDQYKIDRVTINGTVKDLTDNEWSDVNFVKPGTFGAVKGRNTLVVYDVAGNTTTVKFTLK